MVVAAASNFAMGAVLTFAIPLLTLLLIVAYGFHQRKPPASRSHRSLFPSEGLPQHAHDAKLLAAMSGQARAEVAQRSDEGSPLIERPIGGR